MKSAIRSVCLAGLLPLMAACAGSAGKAPALTQHDFGVIAETAARPPALPLRGLAVLAPRWLSGTAMQYRLVYADASRRESYAGARWVAPPAELLEHAWRRRLVNDPAATVGCRLRIDLDEFQQVFDSQSVSRVHMAARLSLLAPRGEQVLASHSLARSHAAASADAAGGVAAFAALAARFAEDIDAWLVSRAKETPGLAVRCGSPAS